MHRLGIDGMGLPLVVLGTTESRSVCSPLRQRLWVQQAVPSPHPGDPFTFPVESFPFLAQEEHERMCPLPHDLLFLHMIGVSVGSSPSPHGELFLHVLFSVDLPSWRTYSITPLMFLCLTSVCETLISLLFNLIVVAVSHEFKSLQKLMGVALISELVSNHLLVPHDGKALQLLFLSL